MSLTSKIAAASKRVGGRLATDKTNREQGYQYLSADAILSAGGQALAEEGVVISPSVIDWTVNQFTTEKGKTRYDARVNYVFTVAADDEAKDFVWVGLGSDYVVPDKAYYKAVTSGHKYFVAKLLNVGAFNEDGEHEQAEDIGAGTTKPVMEAAPRCPKCSGPMWDNREGKKNPKAPDFKCKNKACDGAIWQDAAPAPAAQPEPAISQTTFPEPETVHDQPRLTDWQRKALHAAGSAYYGKAWEDKRHELVSKVTRGRTQSSADLTPIEANTLIDGINRKANEDAAKTAYLGNGAAQAVIDSTGQVLDQYQDPF